MGEDEPIKKRFNPFSLIHSLFMERVTVVLDRCNFLVAGNGSCATETFAKAIPRVLLFLHDMSMLIAALPFFTPLPLSPFATCFEFHKQIHIHPLGMFIVVCASCNQVADLLYGSTTLVPSS